MTIEQAFQTLELPATATFDQVKQTYRELIKVWHPDRFPGDAKFQARATRKVQDINLAYDVLELHYQQPPPPAPKPNNDEEMFSRWVNDVDKQQRQAEADRAAYPTLNDLMLHFANQQPYKVYPCHIQRSNDHSLTPERLWGFGLLVSGVIAVISYLMTPVPTLLTLTLILTLTMRAIDWYGKKYLPPDALLMTDTGMVFLEGIRRPTMALQLPTAIRIATRKSKR